MKESIGFDLDGVLYPWTEVVYRELCILYKIDEDYDTFWCKQSKGVDNYGKLFWENICKVRAYYSSAKIRPDHLAILQRYNSKYNIYYITNRPTEVELASKNWLKRELIPQYENLIITPDKAATISNLNLIAFTEDRNENVNRIKELCMTFIYTQPWNLDYINPDSSTHPVRINDLKDLEKYI